MRDGQSGAHPDWHDAVSQALDPPPRLDPAYRDEQVLKLLAGDGLRRQAAYEALAQDALALLAELAGERACAPRRFAALVNAGAPEAAQGLLDYRLEDGDVEQFLRHRILAALDAVPAEPWRGGPRQRLSPLAA